MDIDTTVLRNFLTLAKNLHFTRSSIETFIAQPALSRQIKQLEDKLGVVLFLRNKRNVSLTPAGLYFKQECERLLHQFDYVTAQTDKLFKGRAGEIRIGYTHSVMQSFLPDLISYINRLFPDLRIVLLEFNNARQYAALKNREIDIGFSTNPDLDDSFKSRVMVKNNFALALPVHHKLDSASFRHLHDLKEEKFILPPKAEGQLYVSTLHSIFVQAGFLPLVVHETPFASTAIRLVEKGIGLTVEPVYSLEGYKGIKYIELDQIPQKAEIVMLWLPIVDEYFPELLEVIEHFKIQ